MSVNADVRRAVPSLTFNGTNVDTKLAPYLESVSYTDVASGSSDSIDIQVQNIDFKWLDSWYPVKGDKIKGSIKFKNWKSAGSDLKLSCGTFILDEISFTGGPLRLKMSALSTPADESFKSRERTQTWKKVTIQQIAQTIASRYSLSLSYSGSSITIDALEQSDETDSAFLYSLCEDYGLSMKVYNEKLVIYDQTTKETEGAIAVLRRKSFVGDEWTYG
ncbi:MAG: hypothetical protein LUD16_12875 [Lachnospiraceae bacterium]|nr:hypothetical protein [Lachnospiraceae bacterium]